MCLIYKLFRDYKMAKILAVEIRVGNLLEWDKHLWKVLKCYHVHVGGRGGAYMQVEMKDIERGTKVNQRFTTDEKLDKAFVESREMDYLYNDGQDYIFMDNSTYEQLHLSATMLEGQTGYLLPNTTVQINFHNDRPIGIQFPQAVILEVVEADPSIKGATVTTSFKPAVLETGLQVLVPPFVEKGEKIKVNTDTGEYMERA
jgi:elongation factor P